MRIIEVQSDGGGAQTLIVTVQDDSVGLASYFHDEDLFLGEPDTISVLDPAQAFQLSKALAQAADLAREGVIEGCDAARRRRVAEQ